MAYVDAEIASQPDCWRRADLILAQRFTVALAVSRDLEPDAPRPLTRSVVT